MLQMVASGRGVAALPRWLVEEYAGKMPVVPVRLGRGHRQADFPRRARGGNRDRLPEGVHRAGAPGTSSGNGAYEAQRQTEEASAVTRGRWAAQQGVEATRSGLALLS